jgi:hypothetical protein
MHFTARCSMVGASAATSAASGRRTTANATLFLSIVGRLQEGSFGPVIALTPRPGRK